MKNWFNKLIFSIVVLTILNFPLTASASHTAFLENIVFPVKNIMSHFYDDWEEIRGSG